MDFCNRCRMLQPSRARGAMISQPVIGSKSCGFFFLTYPEQPLVSPIKQRGERGALKESGTGPFPLFLQQRVLPVSPSTAQSRLAAQIASSGEEWLRAVPRSCPAWLPGDPGPAPSPVPGPGTSSPAARRCQTAGSCGDTATTASCRGLQHGGGRGRPWGAGLSQALIPAVGFLSSFLLSPVLSAGSGGAESGER